MTTSDYKRLLLEQVRARARAEAVLSADIGDPITPDYEPDRAAILAHFRQQVDGQVERYERGGSEPYVLAMDLAEAYADTFRDVLREVGRQAPAKAPPLDIPSPFGIVTEPYIKVEFDLAFWGGDYDQAGAIAKVPVRLVEYYNDNVGIAFEMATSYDKCHIVSWQEDELVDDERGEEHLVGEYEEQGQ